MDKVICVKVVEVKKPGWVAITDEEGKVHNCFKNLVKIGNFDILENSQNKSIKMTKEKTANKDGKTFWNVIGVEAVEGIFQKEAIKDMKKLSSNMSYALSYIKDLIVADKLPLQDWYFYAELFRRYLDGELPEDTSLDAKIITYMVWMAKEKTK